MDGTRLQLYFYPAVLKRTNNIVDIGVSNAFNCQPAVPVVFQHLPRNLINVAPGFVIDHFHTSMRHGRRK